MAMESSAGKPYVMTDSPLTNIGAPQAEKPSTQSPVVAIPPQAVARKCAAAKAVITLH